MLLALLLGIPALAWATSTLGPSDGLGGWAMADWEHPLHDASWLLLGVLPAVLLAAVVAAAGNPLTGLFTLGATLSVGLAGLKSESAAGVLRRSLNPSAVTYIKLSAELLAWGLATAGVWLALQWAAPRIAARLPKRLRSEHATPPTAVPRFGFAELGSLGVTAMVGAALTWVLVQDNSAAQAMGSVLVAFTIAPLLGQSISPAKHPLAVLLAPAVAGVGGYLFVALTLGRTEGALLQALFDGSLPGVGRVLPLHYAAAGLMGVCIGLGVWQMTLWTKTARPAD